MAKLENITDYVKAYDAIETAKKAKEAKEEVTKALAEFVAEIDVNDADVTAAEAKAKEELIKALVAFEVKDGKDVKSNPFADIDENTKELLTLNIVKLSADRKSLEINANNSAELKKELSHVETRKYATKITTQSTWTAKNLPVLAKRLVITTGAAVGAFFLAPVVAKLLPENLLGKFAAVTKLDVLADKIAASAFAQKVSAFFAPVSNFFAKVAANSVVSKVTSAISSFFNKFGSALIAGSLGWVASGLYVSSEKLTPAALKADAKWHEKAVHGVKRFFGAHADAFEIATSEDVRNAITAEKNAVKLSGMNAAVAELKTQSAPSKFRQAFCAPELKAVSVITK